MKWVFKILFKLLWRVEVRGLEHYAKVDQSQQPLLIVANHVSLLDGPLIDLFVPGRTTFMIHASHTGGWKRWILKMADFIEVDMHSPLAAKHMIQALKAGKQGMIFPEGRVTTTGGLMKVYDGTALVADKTQAAILPVHIENAQFSKLSYLDGRFRWVRRFWFPRIRITLLPPQTLAITQGLKGHARHAELKQAMFTLMRDSQFNARYQPQTLTQALLSAQQHDQQAWSIADAQGTQLGLKKLVLAARVLGYQLDQTLVNQKQVGVMLPNVAGVVATFFALQAYGRIPAMLNFTSGEAALISACRTAQVQSVLTSRKFIELAGLETLAEALAQEVELIYLEDIREQITLGVKLKALLRSKSKLPGLQVAPDQPAVILFTSGSEGAPKAVLLSHQNIVANVEQISAMFPLLPGDGVFNALPTFHSFGLTAGLLWPLFKGARVELHPSPLHYHIIPERIYQTNARLFFATDTFYNGYARKADAYDFYSIDALVAGAEKLRPETRQRYADQFHKPIFEGYGVTEAAPVLAVNIPQMCQHGTVGQFVPGIEHRIEPVAGLPEGGRLWVRGPNIMLGYYKADNPGLLVPPPDGWYDTGDIVKVNEQGFVTILGRAKRFAKIAGEMVSLAAVEAAIAKVCHQGQAIAVRQQDAHKGEKLCLVTDDAHLSKQKVAEAIRLAGLSELAIPKTILLVDKIPLLGTGKVDYLAVDALAQS